MHPKMKVLFITGLAVVRRTIIIEVGVTAERTVWRHYGKGGVVGYGEVMPCLAFKSCGDIDKGSCNQSFEKEKRRTLSKNRT